MTSKEQPSERAKRVKIRLYSMGISIQGMANILDKTRVHVSMVLNGNRISKALLDQIEEHLDSLEEEDPELKIAA